MNTDSKKTVYETAKRLGLRSSQILTPSWSDADLVTLAGICAKNRMDPYDLLAVFTSESGADPTARNPRNKNDWPVAVGLNQLTRVAAAAAGLIPKATAEDDTSNYSEWKTFADSVVKMSVAQQLPLVDNYYASAQWTKAGNVWKSAAKIYAYNAAAGTDNRDIDDGSVVYSPGTPGYNGNTGLDLDGVGGITGKDLRRAIETMWERPVYQALFLRLGAPTLRQGYQKGWTDAVGRYPSNASLSVVGDPGIYQAGYDDGYQAGSMAPANAAFALPSYLLA
jgi:hypothetical protein